MEVDTCIASLIQYGLDCGLIEPCDRTYLINQLLQTLKLDSYHPAEPVKLPLEEILRQLLDDAVAVLVFPVPYTLQELLTAQIMAGQTLCVAQFLFHLDLSGNAGVVTAGEPQRLIALHPFVTDQDILLRAVHGMAHVELSGNIGGRHNDGKRLFVRIGIGVEAVVVHPHLINAGLHLTRIIHFR